ncbi:MAG: sulfite exporter TauE/SafE family protein [Anaerolineales bacterium]|nr:sulfite exporter TauE/SafE family protein [Anaerolineales bacterium]
MPPIALLVSVFTIAFLYAGVGFGGATGYLAVMSLFDIPVAVMASTALILNLFVSSVSFTIYYRAGHFKKQLLWPFVITSVPAAFTGGYLPLQDTVYNILLYGVLTFVMLRMLFFSNADDDSRPRRPLALPVGMLTGTAIGLLSGMIGIGGGIFLAPLIILTRWGTTKQASTVAAAFIFTNSASGLIGRALGGNFALNNLGLYLLPLGILAAFGGAYLGAKKLSSVMLRRLLGLVLLISIAKYVYGAVS